MKNSKSIIGGSVAREFLAAIAAGKTCQWREINRSSFHARACMVRGVPSGGIIVTRHTEFPCGFSDRRAARAYISAHRASEAERLICDFITTQIRLVAQENFRIAHAQGLERLCEPLISRKDFMRAVIRREKTKGQTVYSKMTVEQCQDWSNWVANWMTRNNVGAHSKA